MFLFNHSVFFGHLGAAKQVENTTSDLYLTHVIDTVTMIVVLCPPDECKSSWYFLLTLLLVSTNALEKCLALQLLDPPPSSPASC